MADKSYDAIVIGGGHHGTIIAPYLAKAGLSVGVFELLDHLGGGAVTEDGPAPGFRMNFCANWTRFYSHPAYKEFNLREEGLEYMFPETDEAIIFDDGKSYVSYAAFEVVNPETGETEYCEKNVKKTHDQIAQISKADAETYLELTKIYAEKWRPAWSKAKLQLPSPYGTPDPIEKLLTDPKSMLDPSMQFMTCKQLSNYFFESPEMRILANRGFMTSGGIFLDDVPGIPAVIHNLGLALGWESAAILKGGTQGITDALVSAGKKLGVEYFVNSEVKKVLVENGKAKGITLADGSTVEAKKMVVGDVGTYQMYGRMLDDELINKEMKRRMRATLYDRGHVWWGTLAIHEQPDYKAAKNNPDVNAAPRTYWAPNDLAYMENQYVSELFMMGAASKFFCLTSPDTIWDKTRAPEGKHTVLFEEYTCPNYLFSRKEWRVMAEEFMESLIDQWSTYAPNMTQDNVIGSRVITPVDLEDTHPDMKYGSWCEGSMCGAQSAMSRFRGAPGGFRTFIDNLYLCSSSQTGGGGIARPSSYNCLSVITEDFGLPKPTY